MNIDFNNIDSKLLEEDDRIVAYLKGQMSAEEVHKFLEELEDNLDLRERAIATARLVKGLKDLGSEQDRDIRGVILASSKQDVETAINNATHKKARVISFSKTVKWFSIAASVVCIVWLGINYNSYRTTIALGNEYDDVFNSSMIVRGQESHAKAEKDLQVLFDKVKKNEDITEVIQKLSLYWELSTMEIYNDYTDYSIEIGWNLVIAHLKDNNKKRAKETIEKLIFYTEKGTEIREKAEELLSKLN
jgi:hypothetical protein